MFVRVVLAAGVVLAGGALALDMSGHAPRTAGSNHTNAAVFAASVPSGGALCQPASFFPADAARAQILIGTFGRPVPDLRLTFIDSNGREVAGGHLPAGGREGIVTVALGHVRGAAAPARECLHVGRTANVVLGGEGGPLNSSSELVDGKQQPGRISLSYLRRGNESWWQLLPALTSRFGLGKASFFGDWTLPAMALLLLGAWGATVRLLARELT